MYQVELTLLGDGVVSYVYGCSCQSKAAYVLVLTVASQSVCQSCAQQVLGRSYSSCTTTKHHAFFHADDADDTPGGVMLKLLQKKIACRKGARPSPSYGLSEHP